MAQVFESFVALGKSLGNKKLPLVSPALYLVADTKFLLNFFCQSKVCQGIFKRGTRYSDVLSGALAVC